MFCHRLVFSCAGIAVVLYAPLISAAGWDIETDIFTRIIHNDNVYLATDNETSATGGIFSPAIKLTRRTADQTLKAGADVDITRYKDESQVDRDEGKLDLGWMKKTERSQFVINGLYSQQSSLNQSLETGGITDQPVDILTTTLMPGWSYRLSQTWSMNLSYNYTDVEYDEPGLPGFEQFKVVNFINYQANKVDVGFSKVLTRRDKLSLLTSYMQYEGDTGGLQINGGIFIYTTAIERELEYDYQEYKLGYSHDFSETKSISLVYGVNRQDVTNREREHLFDPSGVEIGVNVWVTQDSSKTGNVYSVDYTDKGEVSAWTLSTGRNRTSDSTGGLVERSYLDLKYDYDFSERVSSRIQINAEERNVDTDTIVVLTRDRVRSYLTASIRYRLSKSWVLSGNYRYVNIDPDLVAEDSVSNAIYLTLNWNNKYFF